MAKQLVKTYDYKDETGKLLFQVARFDPKSFAQRRPNPAYDPRLPKGENNQEWLWDLVGVRRVLYRLPDLRAYLEKTPGRWVLYVSGEKDVDRAYAAGIPAVTNPMGDLSLPQSKGGTRWDPTYADTLAGCNVLVVPDNDESGYTSARLIAENITAKAKAVRILKLPDMPYKGDFSDWWGHLASSGATLDQAKKLLGDMAKAAPPWPSHEAEALLTWPVEPANGCVKKPEPEAKPEAKPEPSANTGEWDGEVTPGLQRVASVAAVISAQSGKHRSLAEWVGSVTMNYENFRTILGHLKVINTTDLKAAAEVLAAELVRGLDSDL